MMTPKELAQEAIKQWADAIAAKGYSMGDVEHVATEWASLERKSSRSPG